MSPDDHPLAELVSLPHLSVLQAEGADAMVFLQGQLTCDVKGLSEGAVAHGAMCNPKGRAIAVFRLLRQADGAHLLLRGERADAVRERLQRYVLRSRVALHHPAEKWSVFGLLGTPPAALWACLGADGPPAVGSGLNLPGGIVLIGVDRPGKILLWVPRAQEDEVRSRCLAAGVGMQDRAEIWELAEIRDGIPEIDATATEEFVPQMLNLDRLGGVSFTKGCYTGQEVVARTHYLGKVKRRMHRFRVDGPACPRTGMRLLDGDETGSAGQIIRTAVAEGGFSEILAVVADDRAGSGTIRLESAEAAPLQLMPLPYRESAPVAALV